MTSGAAIPEPPDPGPPDSNPPDSGPPDSGTPDPGPGRADSGRADSATGRSGATVYRGKGGQWAFMAHRVSGFLVFFFLLLHIVDVATIRWPGVYDEIHSLYGNVLLRMFEVGLLFALLFHTLNGLRIVAVDFFPGQVRRERLLLRAVMVITLAAGLPGAFVIMKPFLDGHFG